jgi:flagellar FliJ protein
MKASVRESLLRAIRFEVTEKVRKVAAVEAMIADFERTANHLMGQIAAEEKRTGIKNCADYCYSTFAKAARLRRDNLLKSAGELKVMLNAARLEHENATVDLSRLDPESTRDSDRNHASRGTDGNVQGHHVA